MPEWLDYQELVAAIYRDFSPGAVVTHDDRILGAETGAMRQIDVSIRADLGGHRILMIIQAKDLGRPADVNVVGEFESVIKDVRASKGVLICSGGFTPKAMTYAKTLDIDLCTVHDATSRKWALDLRIPLIWVEPTVDFVLEFTLAPNTTNTEDIALNEDAGTWLLSWDGGKSVQSVSQLLCARWNELGAPRTTGEQHRLEISCDGLELRLGESFWCPLASFAFVYTIRLDAWAGTFTFAQYRGIKNVSTGMFHAKIRLTDKEIPISRDPEWVPIKDLAAFELANPDRIRVEKSVPTVETLIVNDMQIRDLPCDKSR
jgi:Restriction endonuclease